MKLQMPKISEVEFEVICEAEEIPVKGNVSASGNDEIDARIEHDVIEDLESGNDWAWCCVTVWAYWKDFSGRDNLGGCSYASKKDFMKPGGYYDDMKKQAYDDLIREIQSRADEIETLVV